MGLKEIVCKDVEWISVAQNREEWWAFVFMVTNFCVQYVGVRWLARQLIFSPTCLVHRERL
jgi:hypothetical protein